MKRMMWNKRKGKESGFVLITLYLLIPVVIILTCAVMTYSWTDIRATDRVQASVQAFYLAEAGIDQAIVRLRSDANWSGTGGSTGISAGSYSVTAQDVGSNRKQLVSTGTSALLQTATSHSVRAIVQVTSHSVFDFASFGKSSVTLSGNAYTDSYDSSVGAYSSSTAGAHGDVGTNGNTAGSISLSGNARVNGDATTGSGSASAVSETENSAITGAISQEDQAKVLDPVAVPGGLANKGSLSVSGNGTVTVPGGTYWYSSVGVSGNGKLKFTGPTTLYVTGNVNIGGNGIGAAGNLPPNVIIYVVGQNSVSFTGNAKFYGGVYAPDSAVTISGNGAYYGSVIGNTAVISGNGGVHYDEALRNAIVSGSGNDVQVLSWEKIS